MANGERNGFLTLRQYARSRGLAPSSVHLAITSGRISRRRDGLIDPEKADREWRENTRERMDAGDDSPATEGYRRARTARMAFDAQLCRLEYELMTASVVRADEVREAAVRHHERAGGVLGRLRERMAPALGPEVLAALDAELARVLGELEPARVLDGLAGEKPADESPA